MDTKNVTIITVIYIKKQTQYCHLPTCPRGLQLIHGRFMTVTKKNAVRTVGMIRKPRYSSPGKIWFEMFSIDIAMLSPLMMPVFFHETQIKVIADIFQKNISKINLHFSLISAIGLGICIKDGLALVQPLIFNFSHHFLRILTTVRHIRVPWVI